MRVEKTEPDAGAVKGSLARRRRVAGMMVPECQRDLGCHLRTHRMDREVEGLRKLAPLVQEIHDEGSRRADQRLRAGRDTIILPPLRHRQSSAS